MVMMSLGDSRYRLSCLLTWPEHRQPVFPGLLWCLRVDGSTVNIVETINLYFFPIIIHYIKRFWYTLACKWKEMAGSQVSSLLHPVLADQLPTYHRLNKFTRAFQVINDAYGVAWYKEVNPGMKFLWTACETDLLHWTSEQHFVRYFLSRWSYAQAVIFHQCDMSYWECEELTVWSCYKMSFRVSWILCVTNNLIYFAYKVMCKLHIHMCSCIQTVQYEHFCKLTT